MISLNCDLGYIFTTVHLDVIPSSGFVKFWEGLFLVTCWRFEGERNSSSESRTSARLTTIHHSTGPKDWIFIKVIYPRSNHYVLRVYLHLGSYFLNVEISGSTTRHSGNSKGTTSLIFIREFSFHLLPQYCLLQKLELFSVFLLQEERPNISEAV